MENDKKHLLTACYRFVLVAATLLPAFAASAAITVSPARIDASTGGAWPGNYGQCLAVVPQASPRTQSPEVPVGPGFYSATADSEYINPAPTAGELEEAVCVSGDGVPTGNPTENFDFRVYRAGNPALNAYAWSFREPGTGTRRDVLPGSSQYNVCYSAAAGEDVYRAATFDNEHFTQDPMSLEVVVKQGGEATVAYYFLTAAVACRKQNWTLYVDGMAVQSGVIGDFARGKYLVFDVTGIPAGGTTLRLDTSGFNGTRIDPAVDCPTTPEADVAGANSHLSSLFISGTAACADARLARLGDRVWEDVDGDGIQDCDDTNMDGVRGNAGDLPPAGQPNECATGVANVAVELLLNPDPADQTCAGGTPSGLTTVTDIDGFYLFEDLEPGDYCVEFTPPPGYALTSQDANDSNPDPDQRDSDADPGTGRTANIDLGAGEQDLTWDAGIYRPAALGDTVWNDLDRDGIQDDLNAPGGEPGISGVTVSLFDCSGNVVDDADGNPVLPMQTGPAGDYLFENLAPGQYEVVFSGLPAGFVFSPRNQGMSDVFDSDADPNTGRTGCIITLSPGDTDLTWDAGINLPPISSLGDRLWKDDDADGIQDAAEAGIEGARVELLSPGTDSICDSGDETVIRTTTTGADGFYEFLDLAAGRYCVRFELPQVCDLPFGYSPRFSPQNQGMNTAQDSDVNPATGQTDNIDLPFDTYDPTWDAGVYCPSKLGDTVWNDLDADGLQDDVPGTEPGTAGVRADLTDCDGNPVNDADGQPVGPVYTDAVGMYMFNNLIPGNYVVTFSGLPAGYTFTAQGAGADDAVDSDADAGSGSTECLTLPGDTYDDTWDAGVVAPPPCVLDVQKNCRVIPVVTESLSCDDVKPIDAITMRWDDGSRTIAHIDVYADKYDPSAPSDNLIQTFDGSLVQGDEFTASGYVSAGAPNDVDWVITFSDGSQAISRFHRSCSDDGMDGPEDCGSPQGDAKDDGATMFEGLPVANTWAFEALAGDGKVLDCTVPDVVATETECSFATLAPPHCDGKVTSLSLRYAGGACEIDSTQDAGKAFCDVAGVAGDPVSIRVSNGGSEVYLEVSNVNVGDVVVARASNAGQNDFGSNTVMEILSATDDLVQRVEFHTSCSQPLNLGDRFGAVEVVGITTDKLSASLGAEVRYDYTFANPTGQSCADGTAVDDKLGQIATLNLGPLAVATSSKLAFVTPDGSDTLTNTVTASCTLADGRVCSGQASATVRRIPPPPAPVSCSDIKPIETVSLVWNGASGVDIVTEGGQLFADVQNGNLVTFDTAGLGNDVFLTLSGAVSGTSAVHVSCSDENMNGSEDCGSAQGNNKGDDAGLVNDFVFAGMAGSSGAIGCPAVPNTGSVAPEPGPGPGASVTATPLLDLGDDGKAKWELTNNGSVDVLIESVSISWPTEHGQLKKAKLDGDFAKDLFIDGGSASLTLADFEADAGRRTLKGGDSKKLEFEFTQDFKLHTDADFVIEVTFDNGQTLIFSAPPVASGAATLDLSDNGKVKWELSNAGSADLYLVSAVVSWPAAHGKLKKMKLSGDFAKDLFDDTSPTAVPSEFTFDGNLGDRKVSAGSSKRLEVEFTQDFAGHTESDFTIEVTFHNGETVTFP